MGVTSIASLHMTTGTLSTLGYLYVSWKDELLAWNSADYCDLSRLTVTPTDIWVPRLVQFGGMETEYSLSPAWLHSNGRVDWLIASSFEGTCILDIRLFPFDKHECGFFIQPTAHDASEIELKLLSNEPVHEISNNVVCATSKASDQPAHTRSLIRAFACRLNII